MAVLTRKNDVFGVTITGYNSDGYGAGKLPDGMTVFVRNARRGERVPVTVLKVNKNLAWGKTDCPPSRCPLYPKCGGCSIMHLPYEEQLYFKREKLLNALTRIAGITPPDFDVIPSPEVWGYRNKTIIPVSDGKIGYFRSGSNDMVDCPECPVNKPEINEAVSIARGYLAKHALPVRNLYVRALSGGTQLGFILSEPGELPEPDYFPEKYAPFTMVNTRRDNVLLGGKARFIRGGAEISERFGDIEIAARPEGFLQINAKAAEIVYSIAAEYAGAFENALDLYCGAGAVALSIAGRGGRVCGIDDAPESIACANRNAASNGIGNAGFVLADASAFSGNYDLVTLDPPRAGLSEAAVERLKTLAPGRIVYISCEPSSLARDIRRLEGYALTACRAADMFPQTAHFETVCLLERNA